MFSLTGEIGNVTASELLLTVELTDDTYGVTQKTLVVQVRQLAPQVHRSDIFSWVPRLATSLHLMSFSLSSVEKATN